MVADMQRVAVRGGVCCCSGPQGPHAVLPVQSVSPVSPLHTVNKKKIEITDITLGR